MDIKDVFAVVVLHIMLIILFKDFKIEEFDTIKEQLIDILITIIIKIYSLLIIIDTNQNKKYQSSIQK
jgi:hypothetical protein